MYPGRPLLIPVQVATVALALIAAGCGGGGPAGQTQATQKVTGQGFTFSAPGSRQLARTPRSVSVLPAAVTSAELESVTRFPLLKAFRPSLWPKAVVELDGVAERLAGSLRGQVVGSPTTVRRGGLRGRLYEIAYEREGVDLHQRLTLLLGRRIEYQLLCRWQASEGEPAACALLETTFRLR